MASASADDPSELLATPLHDRHVALGARMVPFAGYAMPVQYPSGIIAEHKWTRERAGLFDVSHMGQADLIGPDHATTAAALERLVPADVQGLAPGRQRYSQLLAEDGGILDDLMVSRPEGEDGRLRLVVNAARKAADYAHLAARLPAGVRLAVVEERALLALQGPEAEAVLTRLGVAPPVGGGGLPADLALWPFMAAGRLRLAGIDADLSRSGYTGEDGFEISVAAADAGRLWDLLAADPAVRPIGLGARDSLRLEGGLCLYGHDIDTTTSPVEAGLAWSIQKRRRETGGFPGADRIRAELAHGPSRRRVGLLPEGRAPAREGTEIRSPAGDLLGHVTSGGFGPSLDRPVAMGYVPPAFAGPGTELHLIVRGKPLAARVAALPFVPARFVRAPR